MPGTTPINAIPFPVGSDGPSGMSQIEALARGYDTLVNSRFATIAARNAAITAPIDGMRAYINGVGWTQYSSAATAWIADGPERFVAPTPGTSGTIAAASSQALLLGITLTAQPVDQLVTLAFCALSIPVTPADTWAIGLRSYLNGGAAVDVLRLRATGAVASTGGTWTQRITAGQQYSYQIVAIKLTGTGSVTIYSADPSTTWFHLVRDAIR